jgi:hypothetical protein
MIWTVVSVVIAAVTGWIVLVVVPRYLSAFVGRWAARRWPSS